MNARRMHRVLGLTGMLFVLAACGARELPVTGDVFTALAADRDALRYGEPFRLEVQRVWARTLQPEAFDDSALLPLRVRLLETEVQESAEHLAERRIYEAFAFAAPDQGEDVRPVALKVQLRARDRQTGAPIDCWSDVLELEVRSALPATAGPVELPTDWTFRWQDELRVLWGLSLATLALLGAWFLQRRLASKPARRIPRDALGHALERLRALASRAGRPEDDVGSFHRELTDIVRDYLEGRFRFHAPAMTREELSSSAEVAAYLREHRRTLDEVVGACDLVKFARGASDQPLRAALLRCAEDFVHEAAGLADVPEATA